MGRGRGSTRSPDLLERARELRQIDRLLRAVVASDGSALLIEGLPGIGKTALLEAARRSAEQQGVVTLAARGGELEGQFPFGVVRQLFEPLLRRASGSERRRLCSGAAQLASPVVLGEADPSVAADADTAFARMHGLYWLTVNVSLRAPTLIEVDDVHLADGPSLRFLLYLARRLDGLAVAVLASARSGERGSEPDLAAQLTSNRLVDVIRPVPLSEPAVARLLRAGLGRAPDDAFVAACRAATGGVPFLVHELLTALTDDDIEPTVAHAVRVQGLGPRTVAHAMLGRLGRMSAGSLTLARSIAVLGAEAQLPRAARLAGLDESFALEALDALAEADVVRSDGRLQFVHPILRAAIYDELPPGTRSSLHRKAAELLAAEGAELDAVAAQLLACEPTGSQEVIAQLRAAAARALGRGAPENCIAYLTRALEEGCDRELRAGLSFELATAARLAGQHSMVGHFEEAHRLTDDPVLRNSAALERATAVALSGEWDTSIELVESALTDLGDRAPELAVRLECFRAATAAGDPRLVAEFNRRLPILRELLERGSADTGSLALLLAAVDAWRGHDADVVAGLVERGWDDGRLLSAGVDLWALGQGLAALVVSEQLAHALELTDALLAAGGARGSLAWFLLATAYRGLIDARCGHLGTAEGELRAALEPARARRLNFALSSYLWFATDVILERPEAADLAALVESVELGPMAGVHTGALLLDVRGRARHATGNTAAGIDDLRRAGETFRALGFRNPNASSWRSALALMLGSDDHPEAQRLAAEELEDARRIGHLRGIGIAQRALGLLEGGRNGRVLLEQAVSTLEHSPARLEHARALVELGAAARRAGERTAARAPLRAGLDLAVAAGAIRLTERARDELAASGAHPRRLRITGSGALTPSELRVARLAAEGRTNNEIAQDLFVTPKTIDTHLSRAYAKLGISSRRAIAGALVDDDPDEAEGSTVVTVTDER